MLKHTEDYLKKLHYTVHIYLLKVRTSEKEAKYVQSSQQRHYSDVFDLVLVSLLLALNIFHNFSWAFIVDYEEVIVCWSLTLITKLKPKCEKDTRIFPKYLNTKKVVLYEKICRISRTLQHLRKSSATSRSLATSNMELALLLVNHFPVLN